MGSALNLGPKIPTDRLLMEWPIREKRVERTRRGAMESYAPTSLAKALERRTASPDSPSVSPRLKLHGKCLLAEVPPEIKAWSADKKLDLIAVWQASLRRVLTHYFSQGYAVVDFLFGSRCFYVLERRRSR